MIEPWSPPVGYRPRGDQMEFHHVLVSRDGQVLKRYAPTDTPEKIEVDLKGMMELSIGDT
jgi:glutathione peroxidase-family protein